MNAIVLSRLRRSVTTTFLGVAIAVAAGTPGKAAPETKTVHGWGRLGKAVKGSPDLHQFALHTTDARGKMKKQKALIRIPEGVRLVGDVRVPAAKLKGGEAIWAFGHPAEHDVQGSPAGGSFSGKDRQIHNTQLVLCGSDVRVNDRYKDKKQPDLKWCAGEMQADGSKGLWITFSGDKYKVILAKRAPVLRRQPIKAKQLRKGDFLQFEAVLQSESDAEPVYVARTVVRLDKRFVSTAPAQVAALVPAGRRREP